MQAPTILALDVGHVRIGVAVADAKLRFARPLTTIANSTSVWQVLAQLANEHQAELIIVGLPRGLDGQETAQTRSAEAFMQELRANLGLPVRPQDEATTSLKAEAELKARGKAYEKGDIDALAATYILEDYLSENGVDYGV